MSYERTTERINTPFTMSMWAGNSQSLADYKQLVKIENAIEDMEKVIEERYVEFLNRMSRIDDIERRLTAIERGLG